MKKFLRDTNIDAERFRAGMAQLTGAVNIIATRNGEVKDVIVNSGMKPLLYSNRAFTTTMGHYDDLHLDYSMSPWY